MIKLVLILSNGNATVESGFSINESLLVENMKESSLVNLRIVCDAIKSHGGVHNVPITAKMITESKFARQRYRTALEENKKKGEEDATVGEQMKRNAMNELKELKKKKARLVGEQQEELAVLNSEQRLLETRLSHL